MEEMQELLKKVEEKRVTLVDDTDTEYEFMIIDEFECEGKRYCALVSCDEKVEKGNSAGDSEGNDITVVRMEELNGEINFYAVSDAEELYKAAKMVEERFGHLAEGNKELA